MHNLIRKGKQKKKRKPKTGHIVTKVNARNEVPRGSEKEGFFLFMAIESKPRKTTKKKNLSLAVAALDGDQLPLRCRYQRHAKRRYAHLSCQFEH